MCPYHRDQPDVNHLNFDFSDFLFVLGLLLLLGPVFLACCLGQAGRLIWQTVADWWVKQETELCRF